MAWVSATNTVEMELAGVGAGWTDVSADLTYDPITLKWGLDTYRPETRCAPPALIRFGMRNDANNSGSLVGYYSPFHANCRTGFGFGIRVRVKQVYSGTTRYLMGKLTGIQVVPGQFESRTVLCTAIGWLDEAARTNVNVTTQLNKRADEVFDALIAGMPSPPDNTTVQVSADTYTIALDTVGADTKVLSVLADLARSEFGIITEIRDSTSGQTLKFENRAARAGAGSVLVTLNETMHGLDLPGDRGDVINRVQTTSYPRVTAGYEGIVLATLDNPEQRPIQPGETFEVWLSYSDPLQRDTKIGGMNFVDPPVLGTDYLANSLADGTGSDISADATVTCDFFSTTVKVMVENTGSVPMYLRLLQVRGDGILSLNPPISDARDQTSIDDHGENLVKIDLKFQENTNISEQIAAYVVAMFKDPLALVRKVTFVANQSSTLMAAAISGDVSSVIALVESVSGVSAAQNYFINGVEISIAEFDVMTVSWFLAPADTNVYAQLDVVASNGRLDSAALLGYV